MSELFEDLKWRGLVHQTTDDEALAKRLDHDSLTAYVGFDPTADSLGMHHLVGLLTLRRLKEAGHHAIAVVGGGTGMIGDPSGKSEERTLLTVDELDHNVAAVRAQVQHIVGQGRSAPSERERRVTVVNNADWLGATTIT